MKGTIKIALVETHQLFRKALISLLREFEQIEIVHDVGNGNELIKALKNKKADVVLLNMETPDINDHETLTILKSKFPTIRVIILSNHSEKKLIAELIANGANSCLTKSCDVKSFIETIQGVYKNGYYFEQNITADIIKSVQAQKTAASGLSNLTLREIDILKLICKGKAHKQIADALFITIRTVDFHKSNIYKKTNTNCAAKLYEYALAHDIISNPNSLNKQVS